MTALRHALTVNIGRHARPGLARRALVMERIGG
jgi:hypothetical protein